MVAYGFQKRFAPSIEDGTKVHTIRADTRRHARPGEGMQLYVGMRTKHCRLIGAPICESVVPVQMMFCRRGGAEIRVGNQDVASALLDVFARADGFADLADMASFWWATHLPKAGDTLVFRGVLLQWEPIAPADARSLARCLKDRSGFEAAMAELNDARTQGPLEGRHA